MKYSTGPRCPNHDVLLQLTDKPGIGICPVSTARFTYDAEQAEKTKKVRLTALGSMEFVSEWGVKSIDGKEEDL